MPDHPIIMDGKSVRAILDGRNTQTRRIVKLQPDEDGLFRPTARPGVWLDTSEREYRCPYGRKGHPLWVRETHQIYVDPTGRGFRPDSRAHADRIVRSPVRFEGREAAIIYRASGEPPWHGGQDSWRPPGPHAEMGDPPVVARGERARRVVGR